MFLEQCPYVVLPPIYPIGHLNLLYHKIPDGPLNAIGSDSLWDEDTGCLKWLEGKESGSVIYVNFGSLISSCEERTTDRVCVGFVR